VNLSKSATKTLEVLREAFEEHSLSRTAVFEGIHVSRPVKCQLKMTNVPGNQAPAKRQKMLKFENSSMKTSRQTIHELADTVGIS
jgi:hypothetical protein